MNISEYIRPVELPNTPKIITSTPMHNATCSASPLIPYLRDSLALMRSGRASFVSSESFRILGLF